MGISCDIYIYIMRLITSNILFVDFFYACLETGWWAPEFAGKVHVDDDKLVEPGHSLLDKLNMVG